MCFPKCSPCDKEIQLVYDEENGSIFEEDPPNTGSSLIIPEDIHEHVNSVYLNFNVEDGILCFVYEDPFN